MLSVLHHSHRMPEVIETISENAYREVAVCLFLNSLLSMEFKAPLMCDQVSQSNQTDYPYFRS